MRMRDFADKVNRLHREGYTPLGTHYNDELPDIRKKHKGKIIRTVTIDSMHKAVYVKNK